MNQPSLFAAQVPASDLRYGDKFIDERGIELYVSGFWSKEEWRTVRVARDVPAGPGNTYPMPSGLATLLERKQ